MEDMYVNFDYGKSIEYPRTSQNPSGPRSSERRICGYALLGLGLLSVSLLSGFIGFSFYYHETVHGAAAELSTVKTNLTELLRASDKKVSSLTKERDQLKVSLADMTEERKRLQCLCRQKKTCPAGWTKFWCSCYLLSTQAQSWRASREQCIREGADLVVIDSAEEQTFLTKFTNVHTWIGLNDREEEGTWKWVDGSPLTVKYWSLKQPDNGHEERWDEENCVYIMGGGTWKWNDYLCEMSLQWICEKSIQP